MVRRQIRLIFVFCVILCGVPAGTTSLLPAKERETKSAGDRFSEAAAELEKMDFSALRLAIKDLIKTFPTKYTKGRDYLKALDRYTGLLPKIKEALKQRDKTALKQAEEILTFQREALLSNPLLDFDRLMLIKRKPVGDPRRPKGTDKGLGEFLGLARQSSWQIDNIPNIHDWENELAVLSPVRPVGTLTTFYKPDPPKLVSDLDINFDAEKLTFSMPGDNRNWQVFEIDTDGGKPRQLTPRNQPDVHNFNSFYLPNGNIGFISTAVFQGVPCNASVNVAMLYIMDGEGRNIRQLSFEQDHNYCPTVMNDGRILYLRWEYTDIPHIWGRYLFTMNPDGSCQKEFYGSGSYWPNAIFFARPIPNHPTKVVGIVTGHHVGRVGELVIFDPAIGRNSTNGVVQRIPGRGRKVEPLIEDKLTEFSWPKYLHPYPLSEKYFIVSAKPTPSDLWGIYLVDVFDNITLIKEAEGYALLDPFPFRKRKKPPVIVDRVDLKRRDALLYLEDIYEGPGLKGVPRGTVKNLRLFTYHFAYQRIAGISHRVGTDGPWEPKLVLGTVPIREDGSALFRVPANTPISIQALDSEGKAVQLMRSWTTAMPGEFVSCIGCHEKQNAAPPSRRTIASKRKPSEIQPWRGPARGFSFVREVQPVLDKYCVACHNGKPRDDGSTIADLRGDRNAFVVLKNTDPKTRLVTNADKNELYKKYGGVFPPAYVELRSFVRVGGLESDIRLLAPGEFHTDTSELFQMLKKGHHGVKLDAEAWDRLTTWIDLNAPCHGTWQETAGLNSIKRDHDRRIHLLKLYAGVDKDFEAIVETPRKAIEPIMPKPLAQNPVRVVDCPDWPFSAAEAKHRQAAAGPTTRTIDLGDGVKLDMVLIPAGHFVMGDSNGEVDEQPLKRVKIEEPFWMGKFEVTNTQYAQFDRNHDSRFEHKGSWSFSERHIGWLLNNPRQPVVRISWNEAMAFCRWLSKKTGQDVTLPTEAQWEWACRAGTNSTLSYGDLNTDFSAFANMADVTIRELAYDTDGRYTADLVPRDARFNDHALVTTDAGSYISNAWGLHDMHGNAWELVRSTYKPYPYSDDDGRNDITDDGKRVVRGGSWYDRPKRCRSAFRLSYPAWQKVYNVGFRIVIQTDGKARQLVQNR
ncbi:MAG: SUMF1/EgtB/PvdO family nonheme iron enzyme [Planctomycetes bacterium]|nr:SUMF1/EgtB/PvdO family nonheme iron enzyme [Planctomycetota bacterium]